jgi:hypothetical protein
MDRKSTLTKTAKGLMEATGKTSDLPRDLRNLLKEIDGKVTVGQLQMRQELFTEAKFMDALRTLERDGYVREMAPQQDDPAAPRSPLSRPPGPASQGGGEDLDFTAIASRTASKQASDIARQVASERERVEAAAKAKAETEARAKRESEEQAKKLAYDSEAKREREEMDRIHREAEERSRKAAEEKARQEGEEKAKRDAEARARREAEERVRREVEEKARREAEEKARRDAEEKARRDAEARTRREAEERARREAEERARRDAEARAKREAEERTRREAEEREKYEAAEKARREEEKRRAEEDEERRRKEEDRRRWEIEAKAEAAELEAQIKLAAEAKARARNDANPEAAELEAALRAERAETEERVRRENEERVRREAEERRREEEQARLRPASETDAEDEISRREEEMRRREKEEAERAKQEAKARTEADAKAAAEARARDKAGQDQQWRAQPTERIRKTSRAGYRPSRNLGKNLSVGLFFILVISVVVLHFVPVDPTPYEKAGQEWLGQPVRIGAVYVQLVPAPHLRFEKVSIGKEPQMRIPAARAEFAITSLFDERKALRRIEIDGGTVPQPFLAALVSGTGAPGRSIGTQRVTGKGIKLDIPGFALPALDVDADLDTRGAISGIRLTGADPNVSATLRPQGGRWQLEMTADKFALPIGGNVTLDEFSAKGIIGRTELALSEFEGRALNGVIQGNGRLRWGDAWSLEGEFSVRQMDAGKIASPVVGGGRLEGKGTYGMKAAAPDKLLDAARMEGNFTIQKGSITNVDMMRILQGSSSGGGTTLFSEMSGNASADSGRIQVRQLRMAAGLLQGVGSVDIDSERNLSGRMQIELRAHTVQARATMSISGSVQNPQFRRVN